MNKMKEPEGPQSQRRDGKLVNPALSGRIGNVGKRNGKRKEKNIGESGWFLSHVGDAENFS